MDGPNTNMKFIESLKWYLLENQQHQVIHKLLWSTMIQKTFRAGDDKTKSFERGIYFAA